MADDQRGGRDAKGQGIQIGDDNTQVNFFGGSQSAVSGRDVYMAGGDIVFNSPSAGSERPQAQDSASVSLSGQQVGRLRDALVAAFDEETFEVFLLEKLDKDLAHLTPSKGDFPYRVFKLIRRAVQEGWVTALISEAARARPGSVSLRELQGETGNSEVS